MSWKRKACVCLRECVCVCVFVWVRQMRARKQDTVKKREKGYIHIRFSRGLVTDRQRHLPVPPAFALAKRRVWVCACLENLRMWQVNPAAILAPVAGWGKQGDQQQCAIYATRIQWIWANLCDATVKYKPTMVSGVRRKKQGIRLRRLVAHQEMVTAVKVQSNACSTCLQTKSSTRRAHTQ